MSHDIDPRLGASITGVLIVLCVTSLIVLFWAVYRG